jgi:hypothetical protein
MSREKKEKRTQEWKDEYAKFMEKLILENNKLAAEAKKDKQEEQK